VLDNLTPALWVIAAAVISAAYVVRGIAGFGSGLIAIPLLAFMLPLSMVVPLIVLLDYVASASHGLRDRAQIQWRQMLPLLPFTLIGVLVGLYLFRSADPSLLSHALGAFIILYALYSLAVNASERIVSAIWAAPSGMFGGLIGTLFGTGGPLYVVYLKHRGLPKTEFRATFATIFLIDGAGRLTGYLSSGLFTLECLTLVAVGLPLMALGLYLGGHIHTNISQRQFQTGISLLLLVSGIMLLLRH
jgi:uncharacterized membrane protein YfcA